MKVHVAAVALTLVSVAMPAWANEWYMPVNGVGCVVLDELRIKTRNELTKYFGQDFAKGHLESPWKVPSDYFDEERTSGNKIEDKSEVVINGQKAIRFTVIRHTGLVFMHFFVWGEKACELVYRGLSKDNPDHWQ